jgi:hypothetical protein
MIQVLNAWKYFQGLAHFDFDYERRETIWYSTVKEAIVRGNSSRNEVIHKGKYYHVNRVIGEFSFSLLIMA